MAKAKAKRADKGLLDDPIPGIASDKVSLEEIRLKGIKWLVKLRIGTTLPRSYHRYQIHMELNEEPYLERIEELESQLNDTLFKDDPVLRKNVDEQVKGVNKNLNERRKECETIQFGATVEELKYKDGDTIITVRVPDDVIEAFNRQKSRFEYYQIVLESVV